MKKFILLLSLISLMTSQGLFAQKKVANKKTKYSLSIPTTWISSEVNQGTMNIMVIISLQQPDPITITAMPDARGLEAIHQKYKDILLTDEDKSDVKILEEGTSTLGGKDCKWFICTYTDVKKEIPMKKKNYTIVDKGKFYEIEYHLDESRFADMTDSFDAIIASIKFK